MYYTERCIYGIFSVLNDFSFNQYFFGFVIFLGCVIFLSLEDSLGNLLDYDDQEEDSSEDNTVNVKTTVTVVESCGSNSGNGGSSVSMSVSESGNEGNEQGEQTQQHVFLFGAMDKDMVTCFSLPMSFTCGKYRIHIGRLLYYNLHGIMFTLAWCGIDSTIGKARYIQLSH
jgi:hypothetical protein